MLAAEVGEHSEHARDEIVRDQLGRRALAGHVRGFEEGDARAGVDGDGLQCLLLEEAVQQLRLLGAADLFERTLTFAPTMRSDCCEAIGSASNARLAMNKQPTTKPMRRSRVVARRRRPLKAERGDGGRDEAVDASLS